MKTTVHRCLASAVPLVLVMALQATSHAMVTVLPADDSGFFNAAGRSSKNDGVVLGAAPATFNYSAGAIDEVFPLAGTDVPRRNYFTFDLSSVTEPITGATLSLFNPVGGYGSPDPSELYEIFGAAAIPPPSPSMDMLAADLEAVYSILDAGELAAAVTLFGEIAGGPGPLGSISISAADDGTTIDIDFNPAGIGFLNTFAGGKVVIGGELASLDGIDAGDEFVFGFTAPFYSGVVTPDPVIGLPTPTPTLTLTTIPEPGIPALMLLFAGAVLFRRRA